MCLTIVIIPLSSHLKLILCPNNEVTEHGVSVSGKNSYTACRGLVELHKKHGVLWKAKGLT